MNNTPTHNVEKLLVAMELSNSKWLLAFYNGEKIRRKNIDARDRKRFLAELVLAKQKLGYPEDAEVLCCYEAGPTGFVLARRLIKLGFECVVIAPSLIPSKSGDKKKTDRRDARKLAEFLRSGHLTPVHIPDLDDEVIRDVCQGRTDAAQGLARTENYEPRNTRNTRKGKTGGSWVGLVRRTRRPVAEAFDPPVIGTFQPLENVDHDPNLAAAETIQPNPISEAIQYRTLDRQLWV
ncbi:IS110 family transposase [Pontiella agarivorans]|uniref:Transposase n=1 Tax=Pontiella agarivorans TaxID=3038953 RepID=A0ABU5N1N5_9BACT|nr:transposase [Pontiella agarivorans]MDZ8120319.1 transposase [Pontiella agarivorans]